MNIWKKIASIWFTRWIYFIFLQQLWTKVTCDPTTPWKQRLVLEAYSGVAYRVHSDVALIAKGILHWLLQCRCSWIRGRLDRLSSWLRWETSSCNITVASVVCFSLWAQRECWLESDPITVCQENHLLFLSKSYMSAEIDFTHKYWILFVFWSLYFHKNTSHQRKVQHE